MSVGYEKVFLMQSSLNLDTSEIISTYVYKFGLGENKLSYGAAVNLMNSVINTTLLLLVNKIDVAPYFNFSLEKCIERVKKLNPNIQVFPISALKGEGIEPWANWLREQTKVWNA